MIAGVLRPLPSAPVALAASRGRVLAAPVLADAAYPSGDRATMDGYVIRGDALPGEFQVAGEIQAGADPDRKLAPGEAMRVFTGALLPPGGGRVIPQEQAERKGDRVNFAAFPNALFIRPEGSEARPGDVILPAGAVLGAPELAMLAQVGAVAPDVVGLPVVRHIATGGEIVPPEENPPHGKIRDTNTTLLAALLADLAASFTSSRCPDDPAALAQLCTPPCDLLLISGGASLGDYDFGSEALRRLGFTIHFDKVNLRPGKPLTFASRGAQAAFVIPGNPVSHFVCFHVAIRLALDLLSGREPSWMLLDLEIEGGEALRVNPRETWWPARVHARAGALAVSPLRWSTSGDTFSLAGANALVLVDESSPSGNRAKTLLLGPPHLT